MCKVNSLAGPISQPQPRVGIFTAFFSVRLESKEIVLILEILLNNKSLLEPEVMRTGYWETGVGPLEKEVPGGGSSVPDSLQEVLR